MQPPNLLAVQKQSFDWLRGSEDWEERIALAKKEGRVDVPDKSGLAELFEEI